MKSKMLVAELWGLGDLVIATPFLQAASAEWDVTLLAKPYALDLKKRFWPEIKVRPFVAPWTAFRGKYMLWRWPWRQMIHLTDLRRENFDIGISGRWDPRDHFLVWALGARRRLGFPRLKSSIFLTEPLARPEPLSHRYEYWRKLGQALGLTLPLMGQCFPRKGLRAKRVLVHTGAGQPVRVWPLIKYKHTVERLRAAGLEIKVVCDPDQQAWWVNAGEAGVEVPGTVAGLMVLYDQAGAFIGNDSGPAHLAAAMGLPTFTLFGPQLPEWFSPMGAESEFVVGKPCPYKPCSDYCRFPFPYCLANLSEAEVFASSLPFVKKLIGSPPALS